MKNRRFGLVTTLVGAGALLGWANRQSERELMTGKPSWFRMACFWAWDVPTRTIFWLGLAWLMFWCFPDQWWIGLLICLTGSLRLSRRYREVRRCGMTQRQWKTALIARAYGAGPRKVKQMVDNVR